ncbi:MAG: hypothetical protein AB2374_19460, partial [Cytobacillus gottheilii]|uniref:hypothetical protein n=1 Tax=Cytobacillus gottheilii TaxID=859144 RepID=UPI003464831A
KRGRHKFQELPRASHSRKAGKPQISGIPQGESFPKRREGTDYRNYHGRVIPEKNGSYRFQESSKASHSRKEGKAQISGIPQRESFPKRAEATDFKNYPRRVIPEKQGSHRLQESPKASHSQKEQEAQIPEISKTKKPRKYPIRKILPGHRFSETLVHFRTTCIAAFFHKTLPDPDFSDNIFFFSRVLLFLKAFALKA